MTVLVADVGGTNTRVGLAGDGIIRPDSIERFRNADFARLGDVLAAYLRTRTPGPLEATCVAIAGPVRHGVGRLTNRDWIISEDELQRETGAARGFVINDLSAQGYALDLCEVTPALPGMTGLPDPEETRLVVGIGTGLNAAPVFVGPNGPMVVPSECGHVSLPVWDSESFLVAEGLKTHHGFASVEEALAGRGLPQCLRILTGAVPPDDPADILRRAEAAPDGPEGRTLRFIIGVLGRVIGDLALVHLPFGGVVMIGGMARAYMPFLAPMGFSSAMADKGRFSDFMSNFGIFVMTDDYAALAGCANFARIAQQAEAR